MSNKNYSLTGIFNKKYVSRLVNNITTALNRAKTNNNNNKKKVNTARKYQPNRNSKKSRGWLWK
jgi:hypothetical protein